MASSSSRGTLAPEAPSPSAPEPPDEDPPPPPPRPSPFSRGTRPPSASRRPSSTPVSWAQVLHGDNSVSPQVTPNPTLCGIHLASSNKVHFMPQQLMAWSEPWENSLSGVFVFRFRDRISCSNVLTGGPFSLRGNVIRLIPWRPLFRPWYGPFLLAPIWERLLGLPLEIWNVDSVSLFAASLGKVLAIDQRSFSFERGRYIRVCIEIDLSLVLRQGLWVREPEKEFFQPVAYENLPSICYACCWIGHREVDCTSLPSSNISAPKSSSSAPPPITISGLEPPSSMAVDPPPTLASEEVPLPSPEPLSHPTPTYGPWVQVTKRRPSCRSSLSRGRIAFAMRARGYPLSRAPHMHPQGRPLSRSSQGDPGSKDDVDTLFDRSAAPPTRASHVHAQGHPSSRTPRMGP
ncbi:hypothetical protein Cni_G29022 [Canna indica]|uniref:DUF4283 domain-containing protein n=1 Tax=Canna indica TaxID=4628 RepID=A0AAQ3QT32_9LILI|nr:hypothetical protein Cni_G29022 [Canna indica]